MRRKPELLILAGLLFAAMAFVLWYVVDRRAKRHPSAPATVAQAVAPGPSAAPAIGPAAAPAPVTAATSPAPNPVANEPVDLTRPDRQTVDFSSGKPVVKNSAEDQAAIDAAMKDIESAEKETTFEAAKKDATSAAPKKEPRE